MTAPDATPLDATSMLDACAQEPIRIPGSIQPHGNSSMSKWQLFAMLELKAGI